MEGREAFRKIDAFPVAGKQFPTKIQKIPSSQFPQNSTDLGPHSMKGENFISLKHTLQFLVVKVTPTTSSALAKAKLQDEKECPRKLNPFGTPAWRKTLMSFTDETTQHLVWQQPQTMQIKRESNNPAHSYSGHKTSRGTMPRCLSQWKERQR